MPVVLNVLSTGIMVGDTVLSSVVTSTMMNGVLDEVIGLLPVTVPVMISFIGLRKGIAFIQSVLHSA